MAGLSLKNNQQELHRIRRIYYVLPGEQDQGPGAAGFGCPSFINMGENHNMIDGSSINIPIWWLLVTWC